MIYQGLQQFLSVKAHVLDRILVGSKIVRRDDRWGCQLRLVHPFPDVKPPRYASYRARSKKTSAPSPSIAANLSERFPHDLASLSKALLVDYKQIANTLSCYHEDRACTCVTLVRENKNIKDKYSRDYREKMFKKPNFSSRSSFLYSSSFVKKIDKI